MSLNAPRHSFAACINHLRPTVILLSSRGLPFTTCATSQKLGTFCPKAIPKKLVHAFVSSRLDYYNSLLSGCPNKLLKTLQLVQNAAAQVLTRTRKRDHITPVLASLHWLPVKFRIKLKKPYSSHIRLYMVWHL
ncbi:hypothetical protein L3Q82_017840 [Scortum barcoo]|uniref:Uncharacterized protein n=1 Tax=Scortum barcoo TaxID=214431 RepID=A0ACB8VMJ9_9TELE|nr:hypothetical protein L3Q82_017840 [Scortum barcoo]